MTQADPKNLVKEAYNIEGITDDECRSIFVDWALSVPLDSDHKELLSDLLNTYGHHADHPMTLVMKEGLEQADIKPKRRGGYRARER